MIQGSTSGPKKYLTEEKEDELVAFVRWCALIDYPKSRKDMMGLVQQIIGSKVCNVQSQMNGGSHFVKDIQILHYMHQ